VLRVRVGYCGGVKEHPSYYDLGDHTEAVSIDFDPEVISYEEILDQFWDAHDPTRNNASRQYLHALFYRSEAQKVAAEESLIKVAAKRDIPEGKIETEIIPIREFTYAEDYHQKYYLTRYAELREFLVQFYPDGKALADSTVAMRLNAYLFSGLDKSRERLALEIESYDLPEDYRALVLARV